MLYFSLYRQYSQFLSLNSLHTQGYYREAAGYYELVLYHQPEFGPASDRLRSVRCIILGENKLRLNDLHEEKQQTNKLINEHKIMTVSV